MNLDLSLINILILFGAIQGLIFSVLLFTSKRHPGAFYLALVMLALVYNGLETFNWSSGLENHILFFDFYPFVTIFLIGPGFYGYFQALYGRENLITKNQKALLFAPFFFQFLYLTVGWIGTLLTLYGILDLRISLDWMMKVYLIYSEPWSLLVFLAFLGVSLKDFSKNPVDTATDKKSIQRAKEIRSWVKNLLIFMVFLGALWTATLLVPYLVEWPFEWSHYYPVEIFLVIFLYWIAIVGYSKLKTIQYPETNGKTATGISQTSESVETLRLITQAMQVDKLYLNPELSLAILAQHTGLPAKSISLTLNQLAGTNFNDYVNMFRVEAFCSEIQKEENSKLTLAGVASRCGFNSPATFQRTFKKLKGETPKVFANRQKEGLTSI
ncbi:AraC family transcriptional regulator [Algoriphagus sp. A40]|uniref:helix-turn-helix domain-containing protein n=1 Tax=Algoriphagus sp. A40 TaxID=1945863 RepID=UPI000987481B|nr:helix-turn-helix domain-containing protein [Algoriphagus sp. A40]OOG78227.1 hypothetical protein B0E43_02135 [Algoriphagus sp. A40]